MLTVEWSLQAGTRVSCRFEKEGDGGGQAGAKSPLLSGHASHTVIRLSMTILVNFLNLW